MLENKSTNENEFDRSTFAVAVASPLIIIACLGSMVHEAFDVRPREIREYRQVVESHGQTFNINDYYNSIRPRYHHRFSDVSVCRTGAI